MPQLLLELFSEEIPARMQANAARALEKAMLDRLSEEGLLPEASRSFATPRRLVFVADGLAAAQPDRKGERKGPRVGAPEKAMEGFLKSVGLTADQLETKEDKKGAFYVAVLEQKGRSTSQVVADIVPHHSYESVCISDVYFSETFTVVGHINIGPMHTAYA